MDFTIALTDWLSLLAVIFAFIISIIHRDRKNLFPIQLYIIASLIINLLLKIFDYFPENQSFVNLKFAATNIYSLLEIAILYYFIYSNLRIIKFRISMIILFILYIFFYALLWSGRKNGFFLYVPILYGIENILIIASCFFYIIETLKSDLQTNFKKDAAFIVICGLLFYFGITTPFFFCYFMWTTIVPGFNKLFIIFSLSFYTLLFISFTKAYSCPLPEQKQ